MEDRYTYNLQAHNHMHICVNNLLHHSDPLDLKYEKICISEILWYIRIAKEVVLDALNDPRAMTNLWNKMPFLNSNPRFRLTVMFDGLILNGMATKASFRIYLILKLHTTLPCLKWNVKISTCWNYIGAFINVQNF